MVTLYGVFHGGQRIIFQANCLASCFFFWGGGGGFGLIKLEDLRVFLLTSDLLCSISCGSLLFRLTRNVQKYIY